MSRRFKQAFRGEAFTGRIRAEDLMNPASHSSPWLLFSGFFHRTQCWGDESSARIIAHPHQRGALLLEIFFLIMGNF